MKDIQSRTFCEGPIIPTSRLVESLTPVDVSGIHAPKRGKHITSHGEPISRGKKLGHRSFDILWLRREKVAEWLKYLCNPLSYPLGCCQILVLEVTGDMEWVVTGYLRLVVDAFGVVIQDRVSW